MRMCSITVGQRRFLGSSAEADRRVHMVFGNELLGLERCSDMGAITKRWIVRESACAVEIRLAWLKLHTIDIGCSTF